MIKAVVISIAALAVYFFGFIMGVVWRKERHDD